MARTRRKFGWRGVLRVVVLIAAGRVTALGQASGTVGTPDAASLAAQRTLERAILLAGPGVAHLPIVLATKPPDGASEGVEAWFVRGPDGHVNQIGQCLLRVASPIVHEAWPYHHGSEETAAYDAQIAFLVMNGGSTAQLSGVRRARIATAHRLADRGALATKSN